MNFQISALKSATFLAATSAALWIGSASVIAAPLPLSYAGDIGASFAALFSSQRPMDATDDVPANYPSDLRRQVIAYRTKAAAGTVIIDTAQTYLYFVLGDGKAIRYGIGVGRDGFTWSGTQSVTRKAEWPDWKPPQEMIARQPYLPRFMAGGEGNPLGARAIYLGDTMYRIHGTNMPATIGQKVSSGCIRMLNADVIDLYKRVQVGTKVVILPDHGDVAKMATSAVPVRVAAPGTLELNASSIY